MVLVVCYVFLGIFLNFSLQHFRLSVAFSPFLGLFGLQKAAFWLFSPHPHFYFLSNKRQRYIPDISIWQVIVRNWTIGENGEIVVSWTLSFIWSMYDVTPGFLLRVGSYQQVRGPINKKNSLNSYVRYSWFANAAFCPKYIMETKIQTNPNSLLQFFQSLLVLATVLFKLFGQKTVCSPPYMTVIRNKGAQTAHQGWGGARFLPPSSVCLDRIL